MVTQRGNQKSTSASRNAKDGVTTGIEPVSAAINSFRNGDASIPEAAIVPLDHATSMQVIFCGAISPLETALVGTGLR